MSIVSMVLKRMMNTGKETQGYRVPDGIEQINNIQYGPNPKWNVMDIYYPSGVSKPAPFIINVHGGAWITGKKENFWRYCMELALQGFFVVNFTYRLAPKYKFPAPLEDTNAVVQWVLQKGAALGMDTEKLFMIGDSAGANVLALYACILTNHEYAGQSPFVKPNGFVPKAIALNCGLYDMQAQLNGDQQWMWKALMRDYLGRGYTQQDLQKSSPVYHVTPDFPRTFVMSSTGDYLQAQTKLFCALLNKQGVQNTCRIYGDDLNKPPHVFEYQVEDDYAAQANDDQTAFFAEIAAASNV